MEKENNTLKNKKHFEKDETLEAMKKIKKQRKLKEQDIQIEEMLEDLDDDLYHMVKHIK